MINQIVFFIFIFLSHFSFLYAQETMGVPPAQVVVAEVSQGMIAPVAEFVGTVFYQEVSEVAAEVNGKVEEVVYREDCLYQVVLPQREILRSRLYQ